MFALLKKRMGDIDVTLHGVHTAEVVGTGSVKSFSQKLNSDNSTLKIGAAVVCP